MWGAASVLNRFEAAGAVDPVQAREIGLVGVPARACGIDHGRAPGPPLRALRWSTRSPRAWPKAAMSTPGPGCAGRTGRKPRVPALRPGIPGLGRAGAVARPAPPLAPDQLLRLPGGRLARRSAAPGRHRRATAGSAATRSSTPRSTTGSAWRWRCGASRSRISPCATRASTSPTADTTCEAPMIHILAVPLAPGAPHHGLPQDPARPCRSGSGAGRSSTPAPAPRAAGPAPPACPTGAIDLESDGAWTWAAACSAPSAWTPAPKGSSASPATTAWPRGPGRTCSLVPGGAPRLAEALGRELMRGAGPVAEAAGGERRRLQRLRGGRERAGHPGLGPGPLRHPVRRLAAPRRRPGHLRPGDRQHGPGRAQDLRRRARAQDRHRRGRLRHQRRPLPAPGRAAGRRRRRRASRWTCSSPAARRIP